MEKSQHCMQAVVDNEKIAFESVRLKGNIEQWKWDRHKADRDGYYAAVGKKAGAGLFAVGLLVVLLSYTVTGIYICVVGIGIMLVSVVQESRARDRLGNLDEQLAYGERRLAELDARLESNVIHPNNGGE